MPWDADIQEMRTRAAFFVAVLFAGVLLVTINLYRELTRLESELRTTQADLVLVRRDAEIVSALMQEYRAATDGLRDEREKMRAELQEVLKHDKTSADYGATLVPDAVLHLLRQGRDKDNAAAPGR